jgi:filamentous hemagglutinin family protein
MFARNWLPQFLISLGRSRVGTGVLLGSLLVGMQPKAVAEVVADRFLGTQVNRSGNTFEITAGVTQGGNLFHSFEQFSLLTGQTAHFQNAPEIQNIFSRVTGLSESQINGILQAEGSANLFLLNPNGIVFGRNASLNVGGAFVATTADAIAFGSQGEFSAVTPDAALPLLTIQPTAFLFQRPIPSAISGQVNLRVNNGSSLVLLGGKLNLNLSGQLAAEQGRIELGGVRTRENCSFAGGKSSAPHVSR